MNDRRERPTRPERPSRPERVKRDMLAEKYKRRDAKANRNRMIESPLKDVVLTGDDAAADSDATHEAYQHAVNEQSLSNRLKSEGTRRSLAIDTEFYIVVCFQQRKQKEHFIKKAGWDQYGDKYFDGGYVAEKMGISLEVDDPDSRIMAVPPYDTGDKRFDKALISLVEDDLPEIDK